MNGVKGKTFFQEYTNFFYLFTQWFKAHPLQSSTGFTEGLSRQLVLNLILKPGEKKSIKVRFTPLHNRTVSSLIIIRYVLWSKYELIFLLLTWFVSVWVCIYDLWNTVFILSKIHTHTHLTPDVTYLCDYVLSWKTWQVSYFILSDS